MQASLSVLQAVSQQLVSTTIPALVPDLPIVPSASSVNNDLLMPSLLFVAAVCRKQMEIQQVQFIRCYDMPFAAETAAINAYTGIIFRSCICHAQLLCCESTRIVSHPS